MSTKYNLELSRSENGRRYFASKAEMKKPLSTLFDQKPIGEGEMLLRHLELGTIKFSFFNKMSKENVDEIEVTTPFILNALCYDNTTGTYQPNNNASTYFRNRVSDNDRRLMDFLKEKCANESLQEEFKYFEQQYTLYKKHSAEWYEDEDPNYRDNKFFFSRMEARYKKQTGNVFKLNAHALSYIRVLAISSNEDKYYSFTVKELPRKINTNDFNRYFGVYDECEKIEVYTPKKHGKVKKAINSLLSWTGLDVLNEDTSLNASTFEDGCDFNKILNYEVMARIATDYSMLNRINLGTIPADLWMEIYRLNKQVPPFIVPKSTRTLFDKSQLTELVEKAPRIIVDWNMPELFHYDLICDFKSTYPHLSSEQKADLNIISRLSDECRHLVPEHCKNYETLPEGFDSHGNIDQVYDLLSERLRLEVLSKLRNEKNLISIPCNDRARDMYDEILDACINLNWRTTSLNWYDDAEYELFSFDDFPQVIKERPSLLFEKMIERSKKISVDNDLYENYLLIEGYDIFKEQLQQSQQEMIELSGMRHENRLAFDEARVSAYEKALHYRHLDQMVPQKTDAAPMRKRKI